MDEDMSLWRHSADHWEREGVGSVRHFLALRAEGTVHRYRPYDAEGKQLDAGYSTLEAAVARVVAEHERNGCH